MTLFFFPHAGGSAKSYSVFRRYLPKSLDVITPELAGRFTRASEPFPASIEEAVAGLPDFSQQLQNGYAVFGHSMGTALAAEFVRQALENGFPAPVHMFLSGKNPPDIPVSLFGNAETLSDEEILNFFEQNGLSASVPDAGLQEMLNRTLLHDVRMVETYRLNPEQVNFGCDLTVLYGKEDAMLKHVSLDGWKRFTSGEIKIISFSGSHFYWQTQKEAVSALIAETLHF